MRSVYWIFIVMISLLGCAPKPINEQAKLLGSETFSKEAWALANQEERGEMVYSLLIQHNPQSLTSAGVKELLGPPTGYYNYDENPAYLVGPNSVDSEYGNGYLLAFEANKATGKIIGVKIIPDPK